MSNHCSPSFEQVLRLYEMALTKLSNCHRGGGASIYLAHALIACFEKTRKEMDLTETRPFDFPLTITECNSSQLKELAQADISFITLLDADADRNPGSSTSVLKRTELLRAQALWAVVRFLVESPKV